MGTGRDGTGRNCPLFWFGQGKMGSLPPGTCEEIDCLFFAGDRKCIVRCQRSLVGDLIANFFEVSARLFPKTDFFTAFRPSFTPLSPTSTPRGCIVQK